MKAALLIRPGVIEVRDIPVPGVPPKGLLVDVEYSATTGTDLKAWRRGHPKIAMPGPFGQEWVGRIVAMDGHHEGLAAGQRVVGLHTSPCGHCPACARGQTNLCADFDGRINLGSFSEHHGIPEGIARTYTFPIPDNVPSRRALFLQSLACVEHALRIARIEPGEQVLIQGIGTLGLLLGLSAREKGATVTLAGRREARRLLAQESGFDTASVEESGHAAVPHRGKLLGPDLVIDAAGTSVSWQAALETVRPGGRVLFFGGLPASAEMHLPHHRIHYHEIQVLSAFHYCPPDVAMAKNLLWSGSIAPEGLLSDTDLAHLPQAFESLEKGEALKYAVSSQGIGG